MREIIEPARLAREIIRRQPIPRDLGVTFTCECDVVPPYGFAPEAGCPIHDTPEFYSLMYALGCVPLPAAR